MIGEPKELTPSEQADHERSVYDYPWMDLLDDEYVITDVKRSKIGLVFIWTATIVLFLSLLALAITSIFYDKTVGSEILDAIFVFCAVISVVIGYVLAWIYKRNRLVLTNRRVFGRVQASLFSMKLQSLELEHVEDVSYYRNGILQTVFDYGTIRLSTIGDEHTYVLTFASNPEGQSKSVKQIVHMVETSRATKFIKNR